MTFELRKRLVRDLLNSGYIKSNSVKKTMLKVQRELFVPEDYYSRSYEDVPLPIPGDQTISAPHMHAITLSELKLKNGERVLEIGAGSGILLAYIREIIGKKGKAVGVEINRETFKFGNENLKNAQYDDVAFIRADGSKGFQNFAPYDKIIVSAGAPDIPQPITDQLKPNGILLVVVGSPFGGQNLIRVKKTKSGKLIKKELMSVVYVPLKGKYGWK